MGMTREPRAMAEVHEWRKKMFRRAKGKTLSQKMVWISHNAAMIGKPYIDPQKRLRKAS